MAVWLAGRLVGGGGGRRRAAAAPQPYPGILLLACAAINLYTRPAWVRGGERTGDSVAGHYKVRTLIWTRRQATSVSRTSVLRTPNSSPPNARMQPRQQLAHHTQHAHTRLAAGRGLRLDACWVWLTRNLPSWGWSEGRGGADGKRSVSAVVSKPHPQTIRVISPLKQTTRSQSCVKFPLGLSWASRRCHVGVSRRGWRRRRALHPAPVQLVDGPRQRSRMDDIVSAARDPVERLLAAHLLDLPRATAWARQLSFAQLPSGAVPSETTPTSLGLSHPLPQGIAV